MAMNLEQKKAIVAEVAEVANGAISAVAAEYRGLSVAEMTELRVNARKAGVYMRVVRNTLARRALEGTEFDCMRGDLTGPMVLAFTNEEPGAAARLFRDFTKDHEALQVKILSVGGKLFGAKDLNAIAKLPTRDEAIAQLMRVMKAPIEKFVRTVAEPHTQMVRVFKAVADKKQQEA